MNKEENEKIDFGDLCFGGAALFALINIIDSIIYFLKIKLHYKFAASLAIKSTSLFNLSVECAFTQLHFISNSLDK